MSELERLEKKIIQKLVAEHVSPANRGLFEAENVLLLRQAFLEKKSTEEIIALVESLLGDRRLSDEQEDAGDRRRQEPEDNQLSLTI